MVLGEGFEPTLFTTQGADLQSAAEPPSPPSKHYMVLEEGFEPSTFGLQNRCSTPELHQHSIVFIFIRWLDSLDSNQGHPD
jgi:hypothetical protein